jgi:NAD-dependent SIR2 family protein deacetylase
MRPSVVLFSEKLYQNSLNAIENWLEQGPIDLMLVIGTSAVVDPAATYIYRAWEKGARVAVINTETSSDEDTYDWYFQGDAAKLLPLLLKEVLEPESEWSI